MEQVYHAGQRITAEVSKIAQIAQIGFFGARSKIYITRSSMPFDAVFFIPETASILCERSGIRGQGSGSS
jgi:hypothetical protein